MSNVVSFGGFARSRKPSAQTEARSPTQALFDDFASFPTNPYKDLLLAYACQASKRLQPEIEMLARFGVYNLSDLMRFTEQEFFQRFHFPTKKRDRFLSYVNRAGGEFASRGPS